MASRDRPTDEEVAAACKEGNPVTKVTMVLFLPSKRVCQLLLLLEATQEFCLMPAGQTSERMQTWRPEEPK